MSTCVTGYTSKENSIYKKHSAVLRACIDAGVSELPKETAEFFDSTYPELYLLEEVLEVIIPKTEWSGDCAEGYEIKVSDIPNNVDIIRFVNSY